VTNSRAESSNPTGSADTGVARTLIKNGTIVTLDSDIGELQSADLLIEGGQIAKIEHEIDAPDAYRIDASDMIVMPGFVDTHIHLWETGVRGIAGDWTLLEYLDKMLGNLASHYTPEDIYLGNLVGAYEQLNGGATSILDWSHALNTPTHTDRAVDALVDSGIRAIFAHGPPGSDFEAWWYDSTKLHPAEDAQRLRADRLADDDARVTMGLAVRGPEFTTMEVAEHDIGLGRELDIPVSLHVGVSEPDGIRELADVGLLGPDLNFTHATRQTKEEFQLLAEHGGSVSVTPEVEMQMGHGIPATGDVLDVGMRPSLGIDVVPNISGEMFTQMRMALQSQRALDNDEKIQRGDAVDSLTISARDALEFATIDGARALGLEDSIGTLTPGKQADIVLLQTDELTVSPVHSPIETIVFQASVRNVDTVFVGGTMVKREGTLVFSDVEQKRQQLFRSGRRLLEESGLIE